MRHRLWRFAVVVACVPALAGCGSDEDKPSAVGATTTTLAATTTVPPTTAAPSTTVAPPPSTSPPTTAANAVTDVTFTSTNPWNQKADSLRGKNGQLFRYQCPGPGTPSRVYGTDVYTDDSSVCTAAVHTGRFTTASGGSVVIEILPDPGGYTGSTRNGITTSNYGAWRGAFRVVG